MRCFELAVPTCGPEAARASLAVALPESLYIPRVLERDGLAGYEPSTLACFLALIEQHGGHVLDVGANVGVFSLVAAAALDAEVTAFEPVPELAAATRAVASQNGLSFAVEEIALGREGTEATFYLSDVTDSSNSLLQGFRPSQRSLTVRVERLDGYVERTAIVPTVLKIDTEATEPDVLSGALATIRQHRPSIICEALAGRSERQLESILADLDYRWYQITDELPLVARREIFGDRSYRFNNWLFAPETPDDAFWASMRRWRAALRTCVPPPEPSRPSAVVRIRSRKPRQEPSKQRPRTRGVYGRKKMLAGVLSGIAAGALADRLVARRRTAASVRRRDRYAPFTGPASVASQPTHFAVVVGSAEHPRVQPRRGTPCAP